MPRFALAIAVLVVLTGPSVAYIAVGGERVTLPEVLFEFPHAGLLEVDRLDAGRGAVRFKVVETFQGKLPETIKHLIQADGKLPKELAALKAGDRVVYLAGSYDDRSIVLTDAGWYVTATKNTGAEGWERYTGMRPDLETLFVGTPQELAEAVRKLRQGHSVSVRVRPKGAKPDVRVFLRCDLDAPHHRWPAKDPKGAAANSRPAKAWVGDLSSADPGTRQQAAIALAELGAPAADVAGEPLLQALLSDAVPDVRAAAADAVAAIRPKGADRVLLKALGDSDRFVCAAAARALVAVEAKKAVPDLLAALKDRDWAHDFRPFRGAAAAEAILALAPQSEEAKSAVSFLQDRFLNDDRPDGYGTRAFGAKALGQAGPAAKAAVPALLKRFGDPDPVARVSAAAAVLRIDPTPERIASAKKIFEEAAASPEVLVRIRAARSAPQNPEARKALQPAFEKLASDRSDVVREAAKSAAR